MITASEMIEKFEARARAKEEQRKAFRACVVASRAAKRILGRIDRDQVYIAARSYWGAEAGRLVMNLFFKYGYALFLSNKYLVITVEGTKAFHGLSQDPEYTRLT